jgi:hypothetical protein
MHDELMILSDVKRDPWFAVVMPLPKTPDLRLLAAARRAARLCEREARDVVASSHTHSQDQVDEMRYFAEEAAARVSEINVRVVSFRSRALGRHDVR